MTRIAITGATGFVGGHMLELALAGGHEVRALTRRMTQSNFAVGRAQPVWIEGTLADADALDRLCEGADVVVHIAGAVNVPDRAAFAAANIAGTQAIVDAATRQHAGRFVHVSSLAAREPALSNYGWSKAEAEAVVRGASLPSCIIRPPGIYGPRDGDMFELFAMARRGLMLLPPAGRASFIHVADLAALLLALALAPTFPSGALYEVDDGADGGLTHRAMAAAIAAAVGRPNPAMLSAPRWLLHLAARSDRLVRGARARLTPDRAAYMAHPDWVSDPAKRPDPALWQPQIGFHDGAAMTARWYADHGWFG